MTLLQKNLHHGQLEADSIDIKDGTLAVNATVFCGKEGEYFISIIPSLMISGYGTTEQEAMDSLDENMETFCEDFIKLNQEQKLLELTKFGFSQISYQSKNFSKLYVNENGLLQGLENVTIKKNKEYNVCNC